MEIILLQDTQITDALFKRYSEKNGHGFDTGDVLTDNVSKDILYVKRLIMIILY